MKKCVLFVLSYWASSYTFADADYDRCLLDALKTAGADQTVADIRTQCKASVVPEFNQRQTTAIENRLKRLEETDTDRFVISPYDRNYILPVSYNTSVNTGRHQQLYGNDQVDNAEVKFQLSIQAPVAKDLFSANNDLWVSYTQQSWWQLYNSDYSSPFRETNYEPEVFLRLHTDSQYFGFNNRIVTFGYNHQSNGRSGELSRSWNRLFAEATLDKGNLALVGRVWWRIPEEENDDNPDIVKYLGHGHIKAAYKKGEQVFGVTVRNNLRSDNNRGAVQLDWTFPMGSRFKGYVQYFNGYGESLIDYDQSVNRIGVGVLLTDLL